jgi:hypothetical protein
MLMYSTPTHLHVLRTASLSALTALALMVFLAMPAHAQAVPPTTPTDIQMLPPLMGIAPQQGVAETCPSGVSRILTWNGTNPIGCVPGFTVDSSGNVGIGTSTPTAMLDVNGSGHFLSLSVGTPGAGGAMPTWFDSTGNLNLADSMGNSRVWINNTGDAGFLGSITIGSNTNAAAWFRQDGTAYFSFGHISFDSNGHAAFAQVNCGAGCFTPSDMRLKTKIVPITGALGVIEKLQGVRYHWRAPNEREVGKKMPLPLNEPQIGFIAQDVEKLVPEAVNVNNRTGIYSLQESKIVPLLVEAMKEQQVEIEALHDEIAKLKDAQPVTKAGP